MELWVSWQGETVEWSDSVHVCVDSEAFHWMQRGLCYDQEKLV